MFEFNAAWIALIATLFGGAGLKIIEYLLGKPQNKADYASKIRDELRIDRASLKEEVRELNEEVDEWRTKYYDLRDKYTAQGTEYLIALEKIKRMAETEAQRAHPATLDDTNP